MQKLWPVIVLCLVSSFGTAGIPQTQPFDSHYVETEKEACSRIKTEDALQSWLLGELKSLGETAPVVTSSKGAGWDAKLSFFKVNDTPLNAMWIRGTPGTFGTVNGHSLSLANDKTGKILQGPVTDVGSGSLNDLKDNSTLKGSFWLVERDPAIPDLAVLGLEGKLRGALGLVVYGKSTEDNAALNVTGASAGDLIPMVSIPGDSARQLKANLKSGKVTASLSLETDFDTEGKKSDIFVKYGARDPSLFVPARLDDCGEVAWVLGVMNWLKAGGAQVEGTSFGFLESRPPVTAEFPAAFGKYIIPYSEKPSDGNYEAFLKRWIKADHEPLSYLKVKEEVQRALDIPGHLHGLIDGEKLNAFAKSLKSLKTRGQGADLAKEVEIQRTLDPYLEGDRADALSELADRIRALKKVHDLAQRGHWDEAMETARGIKDFQWADKVSPQAFMDYSLRQFQDNAFMINPSVWDQLQKGKANLDAALQVLENEIDRLDGKLTDNFFKLQKSLENLQKI